MSHEFPPFAIGGIGYQCYDLAYSLSRKKIDTVVLCGNSPHKRIEKPNDFLTVIRLPYIDVPPRYFWFQLQNFRVLQKLVADCSVIHGVNPISSAIAAYYKRRLGKPFVVTCHHSGLHEMKEFLSLPTNEWTIGNFSQTVLSYPLDETLTKICCKSADHIVIPGLSTLNYIKNTRGYLDLKKTSVIYNGIDFDKMSKIADNCDEDREEDSHADRETSLSIAFYGRLVSTKGIMYLLDAMVILAAEFPSLHLSIFGKGPLENKIRLKIDNLGLQSKVKLFGFVPYDQLIRRIGEVSVVALPSLVEVGPSIAALEAMACKKPIVVFDTAFSREFISNMQNGILARACDAKDLSDKIRILLVDEKLRRKMGQNAYAYVRKNHDWNIIVNRYAEIYAQVLH
jgi:glycosyltransferase involved in cell wall biosynthesis